MKRCIRCGIRKPLEDYRRNVRMRDGRLRVCKSCMSEAAPVDPQAQHRARVALFQDVPRDWRVSGLAFEVRRGLARSADGDWFAVRGEQTVPILADEVDPVALAQGGRRWQRYFRG